MLLIFDLLSHTKQSETDTHWNTTPLHSQTCLHTLMHMHRHTYRLYVCKLGWICNLMHAHVHRFPCMHPHTWNLYSEFGDSKCLIKQKQGMHTHTTINSIIIYYHTYLIIHTKQSETDTHWNTTPSQKIIIMTMTSQVPQLLSHQTEWMNWKCY